MNNFLTKILLLVVVLFEYIVNSINIQSFMKFKVLRMKLPFHRKIDKFCTLCKYLLTYFIQNC